MVDNYRTVMLPTIDVIAHDTFEFRRQDHEDKYASRGLFDWTFKYRLVPLLPSATMQITKPFEVPIMAGGLFVITSKYFWELGAYDDGLDTYGVIELSIRSLQYTLKLIFVFFCLSVFLSHFNFNRRRTI